MTSRSLARKIADWIPRSGLATRGSVGVSRFAGTHVVLFEVRTTKTRASSIVTRLGLAIASMANGHEFSVDKEVDGDLPRYREDLATWKIEARVRPQQRKVGGFVLLDRKPKWTVPGCVEPASAVRIENKA